MLDFFSFSYYQELQNVYRPRGNVHCRILNYQEYSESWRTAFSMLLFLFFLSIHRLAILKFLTEKHLLNFYTLVLLKNLLAVLHHDAFGIGCDTLSGEVVCCLAIIQQRSLAVKLRDAGGAILDRETEALGIAVE